MNLTLVPAVGRRGAMFLVMLCSWLLASKSALAQGASSGEVSTATQSDLSDGVVDTESEQETRPIADAGKIFHDLAMKAADGNEAVADELTALVESVGRLGLPPSLQTEGVPTNAAKARELLAGMFLNSDNPALWPTGHSWLDRSVQDGSVASLERQAIILLNGSHGREKSVPQAIELLKRARQLPGANQAHFLLGNLASRGIGMPQDGALALAYFRDGAQAGSIPCLVGLHELYRNGRIVDKDLEEAAKLGNRAVELGSANAAFQMGVFFEEFLEDAPNWGEAAKYFQIASERGQGNASKRLASYFREGRLGAEDLDRAVELYRLAADQGDAEACFLLAQCYFEGISVSRDLVASTAWLRVAAGRGHVPSQNEVGMRLSRGLGVARDFEAAIGWFMKAAEKGYPPSMVNLGGILENGVGVEKNLLEARRLYEAAAKADHAGAQIRLARMLATGSATGAPDPVGAAYWAEVSARNDERSRSIADDLRAALTEIQRGELQRRLDALGS